MLLAEVLIGMSSRWPKYFVVYLKFVLGTKSLFFILQIHANCRIRRVYFSDRLYSEDELPAEFKLYLPVQNKAPVGKQ